MGATRTGAGWGTRMILILGLVVTAIFTVVHGDAGSSEAIAARDAWNLIHVVQIFSYFLIAIGALAYATAPGRQEVVRVAMAFLVVGAALVAMGHVVDGPVRVEMHEGGLGDGDALYDHLIDTALWFIVPGYVFMGVAGALHAFSVLASSKGARRGVAVVAGLLFLVGSTAGWGSELLGVVPGITFLAFVLGWLWAAWALATEGRQDTRTQPTA